MPLNLAMAVMSGAEFLLWAALGYLFWKRKLFRRFPAMGSYLALHVASTPVMLCTLYFQSQPWASRSLLNGAYFWGFYGVYIASAILLFFIAMEVFRSALSAFSGLMKFGIVIFRWAVLASVLVTFSTVSYSHRGVLIIPDIAFGLMRSVSILELCLLAFLCLSMNALKLPIRDLAFGISFGFGMFASNDLVLAAVIRLNSSLTEPFQFVYQGVVLATLGMWVAYVALPEPVRKPVVMPANSTIYRWNEIASALGHTGTQVAVVQATTSSFFLTDVEKVVDKVLTRNLRESETKS
jgi:hypothetical protein